MTTPERFRRRQRIEGAALVFLGIFSIGTAFYFDQADREQRECFESTLSKVIEANEGGRAALATTLDAQGTVVLNALSGVYKTPADVQQAREEYIAAQHKADRLRKEAPLPPDPKEVCR